MIIVKGATRAHPSEEWIELALGEEDQYGQPFEIVELRWNNSPHHKMADYAKTRGFEDTIISSSRRGEISINYRSNGSIMWYRPNSRVARWVGKLAKTAKNMRLLAKMYRDRLWRISDPYVEAQVRAMSEKMWESMPDDQRKFNEARIRQMHTDHLEGDLKAPDSIVSPDVEKEDIREEKREQFRARMDLERREKEIARKEQRLTKLEAEEIRKGKEPVQYHEGYLSGMKIYELRKIARKWNITIPTTAKKPDIVKAILSKQDIPVTNVVNDDSIVKPSLDLNVERNTELPEDRGLVAATNEIKESVVD